MLSEALIVHHIPGRIRLRIPSKRGDTAYFRKLEKQLANRGDLARVTATPRSGSLLISSSEEAIKRLIEEIETSKMSLVIKRPVQIPLKERIAGPVRSVNRSVEEISGGDLDLADLLLVLLLGLGLYELLRGNFRNPPWYTVFWYAFGVFSKSAVDSVKNTQ
jgi:hypothetical protein